MEVTTPSIPYSTLPLGSGPDLAKVLELDQAIIEARKEFGPLHRSGQNTAFSKGKPHRFATQDDVYACVMPTLTARGITVSSCVWMVEGKPFVVTTISHGNGGYRSSLFPVADVTPQKAGGAMTYGTRYNICSLLSLQIEDDDDGNVAQGVRQQADGNPSSRPANPSSRPAPPAPAPQAAPAPAPQAAPASTNNSREFINW